MMTTTMTTIMTKTILGFSPGLRQSRVCQCDGYWLGRALFGLVGRLVGLALLVILFQYTKGTPWQSIKGGGCPRCQVRKRILSSCVIIIITIVFALPCLALSPCDTMSTKSANMRPIYAELYESASTTGGSL
ncbi:hypothetical protein V1515DRAFT_116890 [Lipomyces mesembrius]